ncbi:helix-turn-helix domain-containing protein [Catellatospora bangladeshensis]|uniref:Transcriptional regulator n=1 Tax=Catellatospora bangladeshensis TaxID=310355 RepID=A0A8J3JG80_9ACTN|nr:helix-turn-helix transcriptional regulator [Catellatospora bangladeshensis]GIF79927.1 transcriptional regulator [Catellatospora bangladeshensis]
MPRGSSPIVRRQRLGVELRRLREVAGLTGEQVVERVGWAAKSKLSRLENGRSRPDLADVLDLLDLYRVRGRDREQLVAIARDAGNTRAWLRAYPVMTQRQRGYAELEAGSARIREYGLGVVPGLLQTPDYARVRILSSWSLSAGVSAPVPAQRPAIGPVAEPPAPQEPETEVAARLARQAILTRAPDPPRYEAILDEQALTGRGAPDEVRDAQLVHLADLALLPNVTIRVLPRTATVGRHFVPYTGFSIYHFPDPGDPETVAVETLARELVLTDRNSVDRYATVFGWLTDAALDPIRSRSWISARIEDSRRK